jgi:hypothetical protein
LSSTFSVSFCLFISWHVIFIMLLAAILMRVSLLVFWLAFLTAEACKSVCLLRQFILLLVRFVLQKCKFEVHVFRYDGKN